MSGFDRQTLELLEQQREVDIVTRPPDGSEQQTTIWIVVEDGEAYVRSFRGPRARWFRAALERPDKLDLIVADRRLPVRAQPATDEVSIARCSSGLQRKYAGHPSTDAMVREEVLETTLRLEPR